MKKKRDEYLPMSKHIASTALFIELSALSVIAFFLTGSNPTMPVYIWGATRFVDSLPMIMALGTILVSLSVTLLIIAEYFRRRGMARAGVKDTGGFI